jgi:hypothetical protein
VEASTLLSIASSGEPLLIKDPDRVFQVLVKVLHEREHSLLVKQLADITLRILPEDSHRVAGCLAAFDHVTFTFLGFLERGD